VGAATAQTLRVATYNAELTGKGPGLVLADLQAQDNPQILAAVQVIATLNADILLITGIDYDLRGQTVSALAETLSGAGLSYPFHIALRPNSGIATPFDLDGNKRFGEPRDAQAYGLFAGQAGMAVLSKYPIVTENIIDYSGFLWADLPGSLLPAQTIDAVKASQRLSSGGHWQVPIQLPDGSVLRLLAYYATPPVFDGPEDRNGKRNHDETAFWHLLLQGKLAFAAPEPPFIVLGQPSLDPNDGDGLAQALIALAADARLQDPQPKGTHGRVDRAHKGDAALDTALYDPTPGGLRVEVIYPSVDLVITGAGVLWPPATEPFAAILAQASRHRPLWVDIALGE
jgi:hypothetical protein